MQGNYPFESITNGCHLVYWGDQLINFVKSKSLNCICKCINLSSDTSIKWHQKFMIEWLYLFIVMQKWVQNISIISTFKGICCSHEDDEYSNCINKILPFFHHIRWCNMKYIEDSSSKLICTKKVWPKSSAFKERYPWFSFLYNASSVFSYSTREIFSFCVSFLVPKTI